MQSDSSEDARSTEGMVDYDRNSTAQQGIISQHAGRICALVDALGLIEPEFRIVDYGCGPGHSAIEAVRPAIERYRACFPSAPIAVCHADQPGNDWNALFALAAGPDGYLQGATALRCEAAVGSFYERLAAEGSVALATSFTACQWLSHAVRLHAPETLWFADLKGADWETMAVVARQDWTRFLSCRAFELRPGGYLLVSALGAVPEAGETNGVAATGRGIYRAINLVVQEMADEGLLDRAVLDSFLFPLWFMTAAEARAPLESDPDLTEAFEIEEIFVAPALNNPHDVFGDAVGDPIAYADLYTGYTRAFADSTLRKQLFEPSAESEAEGERLADAFYRRFNRLYRASPGTYACEVWPLTVVLKRR